MTLREHVEWALVRYLRRRGWVVMTQEKWLNVALYEAERKAGR